jgi:exodeoxyribonuclease VII small subunit
MDAALARNVADERADLCTVWQIALGGQGGQGDGIAHTVEFFPPPRGRQPNCTAARPPLWSSPEIRQREQGMAETPVTELSFEQAMAELEDVVGRLERGDVALDESIALYERGAALKKRCEAKLKEAEEKVAAITLDAEGNPTGTALVEGP